MLRFAPSPTGDMHIDNLRVALFNYIVSKQKNENMIVRIEDTNKESNVEGKDKEILDLLDLFGIEYSQVIYQSENIRFHTAMALELIHNKKAFSCFCSTDWLDKKRDEAKENKNTYKYDDACRNLPDELVIDNMNPFTIRISRPNETIIIDDKIIGTVSFEADAVDSFIIMSEDKRPTYNFSCAVDDMIGDISLVIRSENHINNTPKQEHIRHSLKYNKKIQYAHLPILLNDAFSVKELLEDGFLPNAIANYLISIGNKAPKEIFNMKEAIEWFNLDNISKSPARFEIDMLKHINKEHLKNLDDKELSRYVGFADDDIGRLAKVYLEEVSTTKELKSKIIPIFSQKTIPEEFQDQSNILKKTIQQAPYFEVYTDFKNYVMKESGLKGEDYLIPLHLLLTGSEHGPDIADIYKYLKNYLGEIVK